MPQENEERSSQANEPLLRFQFPEKKDEEVYLIELEDGTIVARTKKELEKEGKTK